MTGQPLEPGTTAATRWLVPELMTFPIASRRCVVCSMLDGATLELSSGEHAVLSTCQGCRTLADHVARAAAQLGAPAEHRSAILELLERCARAGLLRALPDLVQRFGTPSPVEPEPLAAVVIRTADRPQLLTRLLASAAALEARSGCRRRWIIVDDSRESANERANRVAIDSHCALESEHIDRAQSRALQDELRSEFPALSREIDWLVGAAAPDEATYGRPLNLAQLRLAGRKFASLDDDVLLEARKPALSRNGFALSDESDEVVWFDSEETLWRNCPALALDPIGAHEQWLGTPLSNAWTKAERQTGGLASARISALGARRFGAMAHVLFTHNHACGDPGSSVLPLQLLTLPQSSLRWVEANPEAAKSAFGERINWRGQTRLRLAPQRLLNFTTMVGIDNSSLLPPSPRGLRSEDIVFGMVAQAMYPQSWVVDLPFGLPHLRGSAKRWVASTEAFEQQPLAVLCWLLEEQSPRITAESAAGRLLAVGAFLLDLAAASEQDLVQKLLQQAADAASRTLLAIQTQLESATLPLAWKNAIAPWLRSPALMLDAASLQRRLLKPSEMRALLQAYGGALLAWPQLWEFCRQKHR